MHLGDDDNKPIALRNGRQVLWREFRDDVAAIAHGLRPHGAMIDLCEDRYHFIAAYAAAAGVGHTVLLPPSRAERVVAEVNASHEHSYRIDDAAIEHALQRSTAHSNTAAPTPMSRVHPDHVVMIGFTSGSTGQPKRHPKLWRSVVASNECNAAAIREVLGVTGDGPTPWIVATVPPQHMYGMELSVLLPLVGGMAVHASRPLFPADIAAALADVPEPRVLVSTPVHLRSIVDSEQVFPPVAAVVCATAPLDAALAQAIELKLGAQLLEMFGSTETCVLATRLTAREHRWRPYREVELRPQTRGTLVTAPWFPAPNLLQDIIELDGAGHFVIRGRNVDMIDVAGKRASLTDLTRRLLAIEGVKDAAVFQPEAESVATIRRVAALVVAPGLTARQVRDRLAPSVDPAFLPRPLLIVDALPRNDVGKLPLDALLRMLRANRKSARAPER
jgi:acyl-coenzyme A synthetase/AMP-(fatty) acid ligase